MRRMTLLSTTPCLASVLTLILAGGGFPTSLAAQANPWIAQEAETDPEMDAVPEEEDASDLESDLEEEDAAIAPVPDIPLVERPSYIGECRSSGASLLTVYQDSSLTLPIADLDPYTRITLTGVLGEGVAQLEEPLGWVRAATLLLNCDAGPDPDPDPDPELGTCYQVVPPLGLIARETPAGSAQTYQGQFDGPAGNSQVYGTIPPQRQTAEARTWQRVIYISLSGDERLGWVAEALGTQPNLVPCPDS
jgi:hypothetical protein